MLQSGGLSFFIGDNLLSLSFSLVCFISVVLSERWVVRRESIAVDAVIRALTAPSTCYADVLSCTAIPVVAMVLLCELYLTNTRSSRLVAFFFTPFPLVFAFHALRVWDGMFMNAIRLSRG